MASNQPTQTPHPTTPPAPLPASLLPSHPAYPTNDWSTLIPPTHTSHIQINRTFTRPGGPFPLHYELHGTGPTRILWIMGLGAFKSAWKRQARYFGHERGDTYTCLVYDNRGVGRSGVPLCRYSTREMALDVVELLGGVGWLDETTVSRVLGNLASGSAARTTTTTTTATPPPAPQRTLTIAGVSLGGMIAQELALLIPHHISSLLLISTAPRLTRTAPLPSHLSQRLQMFLPRPIDTQLSEIAARLFSDDFLNAADTENVDENGTPIPGKSFPTNRDRFAASELAKRADKAAFTRTGFVLQAIAAGWHHKSAAQLAEMARVVGGRRICVMHGTGDRMIPFEPHVEMFREGFGGGSGVEFVIREGKGHVLMWEGEREFNEAVEGFVGRCGGLEG